MIEGLAANNVVITMAGRGSRFADAGYTVPKFEIVAHGRSLFDWSMLSLSNFLSSESRVIFVCLAENHSCEFIQNRCQFLGLNNVKIVELEEVTDGQATSAYLSRHLWHLDLPLLIYNIDTYVEPSTLQPIDIRIGSDGWVPCFQVPGDHWSFVKLGEDGWAVDVVEKKRISEFASVGLYWFAKAQDYMESYERFFSDPLNLVSGERYVAPLYRDFLARGKHISISVLPRKAVHALGTPAELTTFIETGLT